jgi:glycine/D-amino acid oxidase-like deaminating enzyme
MTSPEDLAASLWWAGLQPPDISPALLPPRADVAVIGGGYTGLAAARALARRGTEVVVLERETIGCGASGRNGGMVLPGYKAEAGDLIRRLGLARARALFEDSLAAVGFVESLVREEGIACSWRRTGHVTLAARPSHLHALEETGSLLAGKFGYHTELLGPERLGEEIGSARYHGGLLDPAAGSVQPVEFLLGLAAAAVKAGVLVRERTDVRRIRRAARGVRLDTSRGPLEVDEVLVATNGYTGRLFPWLARRVVPVGSYVIATEPLAVETQRRLIPRGRMLSDTKNLLYYFRLSPDGRLVFGGRAAFVPTALERSRDILRQGMIEVFPELAAARIEFAWGGTLGFTLDQMPHAGRRDGVSFALGYGGHGVALASWLGDQVGQALAGAAAWPILSEIPFRAIPFYEGRPWFLPLAGAYYGLRDRLW